MRLPLHRFPVGSAWLKIDGASCGLVPFTYQCYLAVGQHQWYHFWGRCTTHFSRFWWLDWDVHRYRILTRGHLIIDVPAKHLRSILQKRQDPPLERRRAEPNGDEARGGLKCAKPLQAAFETCEKMANHEGTRNRDKKTESKKGRKEGNEEKSKGQGRQGTKGSSCDRSVEPQEEEEEPSPAFELSVVREEDLETDRITSSTMTHTLPWHLTGPGTRPQALR